MRYYRVNKWGDFQHYKERNPPWIRLYNSLLLNPEFLCLQDASKLHLIMIWLLASKTENKIPDDPDLLSKLLVVSTPVDITPIVNAGFLIPYEDASATLAECLQLATPETETETETEKEKEKTYCSEPLPVVEPEPPVENDPVIMEFPTKRKGKYFRLTQSKLDEYRENFPHVDVMAEFRKARQWLIDNPCKRKTNVPAFLTRWLGNDRGSFGGNGKATKPASRSPCKALESPENKARYELKETPLPGWDGG